MITAGLEASYPVLLTTSGSSHVVEPIAQVFVRPDERLAGGIPNEDAQSFVFDATSLFERDKFSGFDRAEGGTRANVGIRYSGSYANGMTTYATFGQSYHLAGLNSFAAPDLSQATRNSGLDEDVSDFVGAVGLTMPSGFSLAASARFDKDDFRAERTDVRAGYANSRLSLSGHLQRNQGAAAVQGSRRGSPRSHRSSHRSSCMTSGAWRPRQAMIWWTGVQPARFSGCFTRTSASRFRSPMRTFATTTAQAGATGKSAHG
jgi:lipopolysaccharide assembly outer membrane protein LptD (OstA)